MNNNNNDVDNNNHSPLTPLTPIANKISFPEQEAEILAFWKKNAIFEKSLKTRKDKKPYVFYDGPPFATGLPHYGHLLAGIIKDIVPRYFAMQGHYIERKFGWDCHGLPVEMEIQKNLDLKTSHDIEKFGIEEFNNACKKIVLRYTEQWKSTIDRIGRWVDFENDYKTMDRSFMESIWWVFKQIYDKNLIYKGFKVVPYSWKATTILSNFEANLNYQMTQDPSIIVKFPVHATDSSKKTTEQASNHAKQPYTKHPLNQQEYLLAWTTTPWTLIANLALAVNPNIIYARVEHEGAIYILAKSRIAATFNDKPIKIIAEFSGETLKGVRYRPPFNYARETLRKQEAAIPANDRPQTSISNAFQVLSDSYVDEIEGVGIVHMAPAYGEEDFRVCNLHHVPHYDPIDKDGFFDPSITIAPRTNFKAANSTIIQTLKENNLLFDHKTIDHSYPFCWRTDTPLMYKAISTWFVNVTAIKEDLIATNKTIHWIPEHIKEGRFGEWLRDAKDWAISRNRYWGTPIPIWEAPDGERICFGDIASLEAASGQSLPDMHKPYIDTLTITRNGKTFKRVDEVLDCWFESGSMPYAYKHYPFENKENFEAGFPADFISEGLDQTRGWFYTLLVIGTCLLGRSPFKNVIVSGLILAEDGRKMSKRLKNYPDPTEILDKLGADALRAYLISSQVLRGETLRFSEQGIIQIIRTIMLPIWNALSFLTTYASMDNWRASEDRTWLKLDPNTLTHNLDKWILSTRETLIAKINAAMQSYQIYKAITPMITFIDSLTNIYIRRSRERFWKSQNDADKDSAYRTLYSILKHFSIILAPFMPFLAEKIYQSLKNSADVVSVHLEHYPTTQQQARNLNLEEDIKTIDTVIKLGRSLRLKAKIRIRQPISKLTVISKTAKIPELLETYDTMIKEELNVKKIAHSYDETDYVLYSAKANFKKLGQLYSHNIKAINKSLMELSSETIAEALKNGTFNVIADGKPISLTQEDVVIHRSEKSTSPIHNEGAISCLIDTDLTADLKQEGLVREFIHCIQKIRKELNLAYDDTIKLMLQCPDRLKQAIEKHREFIQTQTLTRELVLRPGNNAPIMTSSQTIKEKIPSLTPPAPQNHKPIAPLKTKSNTAAKPLIETTLTVLTHTFQIEMYKS
ncbi:isoleucine--tRNA ligase [Spirochaetota bacterium]|nr:isoleucine--tRNA ligase [Spirochaetota bacterium]